MTADPHLWPPEAAEAIRAELVRVTLTGDDRPELEQPSLGEALGTLREVFGRVAEAVRRVADAVVEVAVQAEAPVGCCKVGATVHPAPCPHHRRRGFPPAA